MTDERFDTAWPFRQERTALLGFCSSGGYRFGYRRVTWFEDGELSSLEYPLEFGSPGEIAVTRIVSPTEGAWGVDFYRPSTGALSAEDAAEWAHAMIAAAELAATFNRDGAP